MRTNHETLLVDQELEGPVALSADCGPVDGPLIFNKSGDISSTWSNFTLL